MRKHRPLCPGSGMAPSLTIPKAWTGTCAWCGRRIALKRRGAAPTLANHCPTPFPGWKPDPKAEA